MIKISTVLEKNLVLWQNMPFCCFPEIVKTENHSLFYEWLQGVLFFIRIFQIIWNKYINIEIPDLSTIRTNPVLIYYFLSFLVIFRGYHQGFNRFPAFTAFSGDLFRFLKTADLHFLFKCFQSSVNTHSSGSLYITDPGMYIFPGGTFFPQIGQMSPRLTGL